MPPAALEIDYARVKEVHVIEYAESFVEAAKTNGAPEDLVKKLESAMKHVTLSIGYWAPEQRLRKSIDFKNQLMNLAASYDKTESVVWFTAMYDVFMHIRMC